MVVLSTLHNIHERVPGYGYASLRSLLDQLSPDILMVELTEEGLTSRREQAVKTEYQNAVFPFLRTFKGTVITLEPEQPLYGELAGLRRAAEKGLADLPKERVALFAAYFDELWKFLYGYWQSPCDVNSRETDALFEVSHRFAFTVYDARWREMWDRWNQHFLQRIRDTAQAAPGRRIVVMVGAEHGYWLRGQLRKDASIDLLPNCQFSWNPTSS